VSTFITKRSEANGAIAFLSIFQHGRGMITFYAQYHGTSRSTKRLLFGVLGVGIAFPIYFASVRYIYATVGVLSYYYRRSFFDRDLAQHYGSWHTLCVIFLVDITFRV